MPRWWRCQQVELVAKAGEAVAPQHGKLVVKALVERFQMICVLTQLRGQLAQLISRQMIESGSNHAVECADFWPLDDRSLV